jgi:pimeloyl-ACP methyl ester carboxylesterase
MLLFLPGLICDARIYAAQTAVFAGSLAVNTYGLTDSLAGMARIALDAADTAGADQFDLFGHSMGGRVALEVLRLAPQRVRRLTLASTGVHPVSPNEPASRAALQAVGRDQGFPALVEHWLPPMVAEAHRADPAIYAPLEAMCLDQGQAMFDAQIKALLTRPDVTALLGQIACPTLVLTGEHDGWAPPAQHEAIAKAIPTAELVIVPGAGHMVQFEAPEEVNAAITRWLARPTS